MPSNVQLNSGTGGAVALAKQVTHDGDTTQCQGVHILGISGSEDAYTAATINGDATFGLDVDVQRVLPGSTATALGKLEDEAHASGDLGVMLLAVRRNSPVVGSGTDGDYSTINVDASGRLYATATIDAPLPAGTNVIGGVTQSGTWNITVNTALPAGNNNIGDVDVASLPATALAGGNLVHIDYDTGAGTQNMPMVGLALPGAGGAVAGGTSTNPLRTDPTGTTTQPVSGTVTVQDGGGSVTVDGTVGVSSVTPGTGATALGKAEDDAHASGDVGVLALAVRRDTRAVGSGTDGDNSTLNVDASGQLYTNEDLTRIGGTAISTGNGVAGAGVQRVVIASDQTAFGVNATATGAAAHDAPVSGNPVLVGLEARTTVPTAVANGDAVRAMADDCGRQVVTAESPRDGVTHNRLALTSTTETTLIAAGGAGVLRDLVELVLSNESATEVRVDIRDATAGTVRYSVDLAADGGGAVIVMRVPTPQATANNNWTAQLSAAVSTVYITAKAVDRN